MHILAASLVILTISSELCAQISDDSIKVVNQYSNQDQTGFEWGYILSDGRKALQNGVIKEQSDGKKILVFDGSYSFIDSDGVEHSVKYYADETGYHPTITVNKKETTSKNTFGLDTPISPTTTRTILATYTSESPIELKVLGSLVG